MYFILYVWHKALSIRKIRFEFRIIKYRLYVHISSNEGNFNMFFWFINQIRPQALTLFRDVFDILWITDPILVWLLKSILMILFQVLDTQTKFEFWKLCPISGFEHPKRFRVSIARVEFCIDKHLKYTVHCAVTWGKLKM